LYLALVIALFIVFFFQGKLSLETGGSANQRPTLDEYIARFGFTPREAEVLRLLLSGQSTAEISDALGVAENTIQRYISSMMGKYGTNKRTVLLTDFSKYLD
jgi:DNA-binding CsgD family transcriptional regulator